MDDLFKGNVRVAGHLTPTSPQDTYPVTTQEFHRGGYRTVANMIDANKIPKEHRVPGMKIYVVEDDKEYRCSPDLATWIEIVTDSGGIVDSDGKIELDKIVVTDKEQIIAEKKHFTKGLTSIEAVDDNEVVIYSQLVNGLKELQDIIEKLPPFNPSDWTTKVDFLKHVTENDAVIQDIKNKLKELENGKQEIDITKFATKNDLNDYTRITDFKTEIARLDKRIDTLELMLPNIPGEPERPEVDLTQYVKYDEYKTNIDDIRKEIDRIKTILDTLPEYPDIDVGDLASKADLKVIEEQILSLVERLEKIEANPPGGTVNPDDIDKILSNKLKDYETKVDHDNDISNVNNSISSLESQHKADISDLGNKIEEIKNRKIKIDPNTLEFKSETEDGVADILSAKLPTSKTPGVVIPDGVTVLLEKNGLIKSIPGKGDGVTIVSNAKNIFSIAPDLIEKIEHIFNNTPEPGPGGGVTPSSLPIATSFSLGVVKVDGKTIVVDKKGQISSVLNIDIATPYQTGKVKPDDVTIGVTSDGALFVKKQVSKLKDLDDVDVVGMGTRQGYVLTVNDKGDGFILKKPNEASNRSKNFDINYPDFTKVYDFTQHINTAISINMEAVSKDNDNPLILKYVSRTGSSIVDNVDGVLQKRIPESDFGMYLYAKGVGSIYLDILTF